MPPALDAFPNATADCDPEFAASTSGLPGTWRLGGLDSILDFQSECLLIHHMNSTYTQLTTKEKNPVKYPSASPSIHRCRGQRTWPAVSPAIGGLSVRLFPERRGFPASWGLRVNDTEMQFEVIPQTHNLDQHGTKRWGGDG